MTCIKTGARVYLEWYDRVVPADLYRVDNCIVIRYNSRCPHDDYARFEATHRLTAVHLDDQFWHDKESGIIVVGDWALEEVKQ